MRHLPSTNKEKHFSDFNARTNPVSGAKFSVEAMHTAMLSNSPKTRTTQAEHQRKQRRERVSAATQIEEVHSDSYIVNNEKHRAKHDQSYGNFSSESENREKLNNSSPKNDDAAGHVLHAQPASRESIINTEPEHEWLDLK
ncbi:unnamed protein product [Rotaria magnacalcarata]|uniref:Uncharacterized protein n=2 Tax=Rotaria magnacalcarata TaxID=392030 RepID=A0A816P538_9BILA|nr:unnamed protein product [Rotaria magnacalcarata]